MSKPDNAPAKKSNKIVDVEITSEFIKVNGEIVLTGDPLGISKLEKTLFEADTESTSEFEE